MTLAELIAETRRILDDKLAPYLWDDDFIVAALNRAEALAARGGLLLKDSSTASVCQASLTNATTLVTLHASVVRIERAIIDGQSVPLQLITVMEMDEIFPGWEDADRGLPTHLITDIETGDVRPYPLPDGNYTLNMVVYRIPITAMSAMTSSPEIEDMGANHRALTFYAVSEALDDHDADRYGPEKAAAYLARFCRQFGISTAKGARWRKQLMGRNLATTTLA